MGEEGDEGRGNFSSHTSGVRFQRAHQWRAISVLLFFISEFNLFFISLVLFRCEFFLPAAEAATGSLHGTSLDVQMDT